MSRKTRVPDDLKDDDAHRTFLDAVDRRQLALSQLEDLDGAASTAEIIEKINAVLASHRTK